MKKQTKNTLIIISVLAIALFFLGRLGFLAITPFTSQVLPSSGLYQVAGTCPADICPLQWKNEYIHPDIDSTSSIKVPSGTYVFHMKDIHPYYTINQGTACGNSNVYVITVTKDGQIIDTLGDTNYHPKVNCGDEPNPPTNINKVYGEINATFIQRLDNLGTFNLVSFNRFLVNYPKDTITFSLKDTKKTDTDITFNLNAVNKYEPLQGVLDVEFVVDTPIGQASTTKQITQLLNTGDNLLTFSIPLKTTEAKITINPKLKIYAPTSNLNNVYGSDVFYGETGYIASLRDNYYKYYLVGELQANTLIVNIESNKTNVTQVAPIIQTTPSNYISYAPTQTPPPSIITNPNPTQTTGENCLAVSSSCKTNQITMNAPKAISYELIGGIAVIISLLIISVIFFVRRRRK